MRKAPNTYDMEPKRALLLVNKVSGSNLVNEETNFRRDFPLDRVRHSSIPNTGGGLASKNKTSMRKVLLLLIFIAYIAFIYIRRGDFMGAAPKHSPHSKKRQMKIQIPKLGCTMRETCPASHRPIGEFRSNHSRSSCPSYFRWIYQDLQPWREVGITRAAIEKARSFATFRLVILDGKVYVERFKKSIQTRDVFTLWGFLQLLRLYPSTLPDLELMFSCGDRPTVRFMGRKASTPIPPLFRYCGDHHSLDIVFPDWSFWGWAEINLRPWTIVLDDIKKGNERSKWSDRVPLAYWRGNPKSAPTRGHFMSCNVSDQNDWKTHLFLQDWTQEAKSGFQHSKLEDQCTYRYKIYIEGWAWSVSEKYIMACNSMTLYIKSRYYDFFSRELIPLKHYWPIRDDSRCTSLEFAVEWGNNHPDKAQEIGRVGSDFIQEELKMEYVYDYMFHVLNEYAKLLKFRPVVPKGAEEICGEKMMACVDQNSNLKNYMAESLVRASKLEPPCAMSHPFNPQELEQFEDHKEKLLSQVEIWENDSLHNLKINFS